MRFAYALTRDLAVAEDVTQAVLSRLAARPGVPSSLSAYARTAILNEVRDQYRRESRAARFLRRSAHHLAAPTEVPDASDTVGDRAVVESALGALSTRHRAAVVLHYYEGLDPTEIGRVLNCSAATVRSLLSRARDVLRAQMIREDMIR